MVLIDPHILPSHKKFKCLEAKKWHDVTKNGYFKIFI
jgi:hypothetical protein